MRVLLSLALAATLAVPSHSIAVGSNTESIGFTNAAVWLRASASLDANRVALLPQGTQVRVIACARQACNVRFRALSGYLPEELLQRAPPAVAIESGRGYINSRGEWIPSPTLTSDGQAPQAASARCRDGSYSFSRSRQGTCSWHGGVAEWQ